MSQYNKPCSFCNQTIKMSDSSGKWLPYNLDGSLHECKTTYKNDTTKVTQSNNNITIENIDIRLKDLDARLKKIEYTLYGYEQ